MSDLIKEPKKRRVKNRMPESGYWLDFDYNHNGNPVQAADINLLLVLAGEQYKGKRCQLTIKEIEPEKTLSQLGYYHGAIKPFMQRVLYQEGHKYSLSRTHHKLKEWWGVGNGEIVDALTGMVEVDVRSHADYSDADFAEFIDNIARNAAEFFNVTIPDPTTWRNKTE